MTTEAQELEQEEQHNSDGVVTVDTHDLKRRLDQLRAMRKPVEGVWDQIERFFFPLGSGTHPFAKLTEGSVEWNRTGVWDSTAIDAAQKLAASIHGSVTSPAIRWFKLAWRQEELHDDTEAASWLDEVGDAVFQALQDSDFQTEIASADQDLVGYGNTLVVEEVADEMEWKGVDFEAIPIRQCFPEPDSRGGVTRFFNLLSWSAVQVYDKFGERTPKAIKDKAIEGKNLEEQFDVAFCVFEREEAEKRLEAMHARNRQRRKAREAAAAAAQADVGQARLEGRAPRLPKQVEADEATYPLAPHLRPVGYVYFLAESGERLGDEGGYYEMPVCWARWQKTSGSMWGHGPSGTLLPTVKGLNAWLEAELQAAAKVVDPVTFSTERGLLSDLDLEPGGLNVARSKDDVWVFESGARFDVSARTIADHRAMIQRGLHNDELTLKDSPAMTAAEVHARYELMNRILGSTLARIETDLLSPIVKITIGHLLRANQLPPMPDKVRKLFEDNGPDFNIEYQGPLARSQRTDEVAAIERVLAFCAAQLKMGVPFALIDATVDMPGAIRQVVKLLGTPANLLKPIEEIDKARAAMQQAQQAAMAQQQAETAAKASEAAANHAQARALVAGPSTPPPGVGGLSPGPVPAQPMPIVSPSFSPAAPFAQPSPPAGV
jgi:hypothetical protein